MRILIALLTIIPAFVFGQEKIKKKPRPFEDGYIIYGDDRGIKQGLVQVPEKKRGLVECKFRKSYSGVILEIRVEPVEVLGFGFRDGAVYHAVDYTHGENPGRFFVSVLVDDNLSLFSDNDTLILKLADRTTFELTSSNYREVLQTATTACPAASQMAPFLRFDTSVLTDFVKGYNKCLKNDPATFDPFDPFKPKSTFHMGISAGMEFSKFDIEATTTSPEFSLLEQKRIFAGALFLITFSKLNAVEFGIIYKPREFRGHVQSGSKVYELTIHYDEVLIPITFRQTLFQKKSTSLQGSVGLAAPLLINPVSRMATETESSGVISTSVSQPYTGVTRYVQFTLGFGAVFEIRPRQRLLIHNTLSYAPSSLTSSAGEVGGKLLSYSLSFGYTFR